MHVKALQYFVEIVALVNDYFRTIAMYLHSQELHCLPHVPTFPDRFEVFFDCVHCMQVWSQEYDVIDIDNGDDIWANCCKQDKDP